MIDDTRRYAPATVRNRGPILDVLRHHLPRQGLVLEIASGSGEHITHFAADVDASVIFQPSDPDAGARSSIDAWVKALGVMNVRPAIALDAAAETWTVDSADMVLSINMIHIAPWDATIGLMRGAARVIPAQGTLFLYGPFRRGGSHTASSNEAFDRDLRLQDPAWGVRDLEAVTALALAADFSAPIIEEMPANNLSLIFRRLPSK
ncbi:MAG: DUF938 domain-containing protein [Hyphomicrobiaceae bacterium]